MNKKNFNIKASIKAILIWILINLLLNLSGICFIKMFYELGSYYSFLDFLPNIAFQSILFTTAYLFIFSLTRNEKISLYSFAVIQSIIFHYILFYNLTKDEEGIRVMTSMNNGINYLIYHSQGLIDIISIYKPLEGSFDDSVFIPESTIWFYILWIVLPLIYYFFITFLTEQIIKRQSTLNVDGNSGIIEQISA